VTVISLNELLTTSSKIAEVHGFKWGTDLDFSEQVCWLELNQLEGLIRLRRILDSGELTSTPQIDYQIKPTSLDIDARGHSACTFSLACIDLAIGQHQRGAQVFSDFEVNVENVRDGVFFLAALGHIRFNGSASISGTDNDRLFQASLNNGTFSIQRLGPSADSSVTLKFSNLPSDSAAISGVNDGDELTTRQQVHRRDSALKNGIRVAPELWSGLVAYSHRILVPASERSRQFGTGGGDAND